MGVTPYPGGRFDQEICARQEAGRERREYRRKRHPGRGKSSLTLVKKKKKEGIAKEARRRRDVCSQRRGGVGSERTKKIECANVTKGGRQGEIKEGRRVHLLEKKQRGVSETKKGVVRQH